MVLNSKLYNVQKSLFNIDINNSNLYSNTIFLLGINLVQNFKEKEAIKYFEKSYSKFRYNSIRTNLFFGYIK